MIAAHSDLTATAEQISAIAVNLTDILTGIDAELKAITNQMRDTSNKAEYLALADAQKDWYGLRTRVYRIGATASEAARKAQKR